MKKNGVSGLLFIFIFIIGFTYLAAINPKFSPLLSRIRREAPSIAAEFRTTPCAPNDYFQIDCNTCYCNIDRSGYLCTENTCHDGHLDTSTTTQIPLSNDTMLIISDHGVQLLDNYNSNDNNLSRIARLPPRRTTANQTIQDTIKTGNDNRGNVSSHVNVTDNSPTPRIN